MRKNSSENKKSKVSLPLVGAKFSPLSPLKDDEDYFGSRDNSRAEDSWQVASQLRMEQEVRGALSIFESQKEKEQFFTKSDVKISRHQFGKVLLSLRSQVGRFQSAGLFVQFMLQELQRKEGTDVATLAAAGTWGLQLLVKQEVGNALECIQSAILPALYCDYNPADLPFASPAIQAQIRDGTLVRENPYFTHSMYVEQARIGLKNIAQMHQTLHRALKHNEGRRSYVLRMVSKHRKMNIQYHFNAWRQLTRRRHVLDMTTRKHQERHDNTVSHLRLCVVFSTWRLTVETSRVQFLTDRLHDVSAQLENSKNQFQLQCFRTDRLVQMTNKARAQGEESLAKESKLKAIIARLKKDLERNERMYKERLATHIKNAFSLIQHYRSFSSFLLEMRKYTAVFARISKNSLVSASSIVTSEENEEEIDFMEVVVRWCNYAVQETLGSSYQPFTFFVPEFFTGEYYLIVLHFVFPDRASLLPNRDVNIRYRLRRICEMCDACGLLHRLVPEDFSMHREDLISISLAELLQRYLLRIWRETCDSSILKASTAFPKMLEESRNVDPEGKLNVGTDEMFADLVGECEEDIEEKKSLLLEQYEVEKRLAQNTSLLVKDGSYIWTERMRGAPLQILSEPHRRMFSPVLIQSLGDIIEKLPKPNANEMSSTDELEELQTVLFNDHTLSRIFYHYAGERQKALSEVGFWRFVEHSTFHSTTSAVSKASISQILDKVNFPQLEVAKQAATLARSPMNAETLALVAKHEVDIRYISIGQFVEIIIRIAVEYGRFQFSLVDSVSRFLRVLTAPSLKHFPLILQQFYSKDVQEVVNYFSDELFRVFNFFLRQQEQSKFTRDRLIAVQDGGRFGALISRRTYETMFAECGYLHGEVIDEELNKLPLTDTKGSSAAVKNQRQTRVPFITSEEIDVVLRKVIIAAQNVGSGSSSEVAPSFTESKSTPQHLDLTFTMFLETFGAFCHYWCPDPFIAYSRKVSGFIARTLQGLIQAHTFDTLVLSAPPPISLEGGSNLKFDEGSLLH